MSTAACIKTIQKSFRNSFTQRVDRPDDVSEEQWNIDMIDPVVDDLVDILKQVLPKTLAAFETKIKNFETKIAELESREPSARGANSYAQMVGVMTQVKNGQENACNLEVVVLDESRSKDASLANYEALAEATPGPGPTTLGELYTLVNGKLNQPMKTAGVIWGLLSNEDRSKVCALYQKSESKKASSGKKASEATGGTNPYIRFAQIIPKVIDGSNPTGDINVMLQEPNAPKGKENYARLTNPPVVGETVVLREVVESLKAQEPNNAKICSILWAMLSDADKTQILTGAAC